MAILGSGAVWGGSVITESEGLEDEEDALRAPY